MTAPFAVYTWHNGSVPPKHRREMRAEILGDGRIALRHCRQYGKDCTDTVAVADADAMQAIRDAARQADIVARPPATAERRQIGGPAASATLTLDGHTVTLPGQPAAADRARTKAVLDAIAAALPDQARPHR